MFEAASKPEEKKGPPPPRSIGKLTSAFEKKDDTAAKPAPEKKADPVGKPSESKTTAPAPTAAKPDEEARTKPDNTDVKAPEAQAPATPPPAPAPVPTSESAMAVEASAAAAAVAASHASMSAAHLRHAQSLVEHAEATARHTVVTWQHDEWGFLYVAFDSKKRILAELRAVHEHHIDAHAIAALDADSQHSSRKPSPTYGALHLPFSAASGALVSPLQRLSARSTSDSGGAPGSPQSGISGVSLMATLSAPVGCDCRSELQVLCALEQQERRVVLDAEETDVTHVSAPFLAGLSVLKALALASRQQSERHEQQQIYQQEQGKGTEQATTQQAALARTSAPDGSRGVTLGAVFDEYEQNHWERRRLARVEACARDDIDDLQKSLRRFIADTFEDTRPAPRLVSPAMAALQPLVAPAIADPVSALAGTNGHPRPWSPVFSAASATDGYPMSAQPSTYAEPMSPHSTAHAPGKRVDGGVALYKFLLAAGIPEYCALLEQAGIVSVVQVCSMSAVDLFRLGVESTAEQGRVLSLIAAAAAPGPAYTSAAPPPVPVSAPTAAVPLASPLHREHSSSTHYDPQHPMPAPPSPYLTGAARMGSPGHMPLPLQEGQRQHSASPFLMKSTGSVEGSASPGARALAARGTSKYARRLEELSLEMAANTAAGGPLHRTSAMEASPLRSPIAGGAAQSSRSTSAASQYFDAKPRLPGLFDPRP